MKMFMHESHCPSSSLNPPSPLSIFRNDEKTAADYKIQGGSVLHLVLALRGGQLLCSPRSPHSTPALQPLLRKNALAFAMPTLRGYTEDTQPLVAESPSGLVGSPEPFVERVRSGSTCGSHFLTAKVCWLQTPPPTLQTHTHHCNIAMARHRIC